MLSITTEVRGSVLMIYQAPEEAGTLPAQAKTEQVAQLFFIRGKEAIKVCIKDPAELRALADRFHNISADAELLSNFKTKFKSPYQAAELNGFLQLEEDLKKELRKRVDIAIMMYSISPHHAHAVSAWLSIPCTPDQTTAEQELFFRGTLPQDALVSLTGWELWKKKLAEYQALPNASPKGEKEIQKILDDIKKGFPPAYSYLAERPIPAKISDIDIAIERALWYGDHPCHNKAVECYAKIQGKTYDEVMILSEAEGMLLHHLQYRIDRGFFREFILEKAKNYDLPRFLAPPAPEEVKDDDGEV